MFPLAHLVITCERECEREIELKRQAREMHWHDSDVKLPQIIEPRRKRSLIFAWIFRKRVTNPQPACECSHEGCY